MNCNQEIEYRQKIDIKSLLIYNEEKMKIDEHFIDPRDNQRYKITKVGSQVWLAENLRFKTERAKSYEDDESQVGKFGYLYDRADSRIVAPKGWRLPNIQDFECLETYIKEHSKNSVSSALKSTTEWKKTRYAEGNGVDEFGMNILPAGYRCMQGIPHGRGMYTAFWTSSGDDFFHVGSFYELGSFNYDEIGDSMVGYVSVRLIKE